MSMRTSFLSSWNIIDIVNTLYTKWKRFTILYYRQITFAVRMMLV